MSKFRSGFLIQIRLYWSVHSIPKAKRKRLTSTPIGSALQSVRQVSSRVHSVSSQSMSSQSQSQAQAQSPAQAVQSNKDICLSVFVLASSVSSSSSSSSCRSENVYLSSQSQSQFKNHICLIALWIHQIYIFWELWIHQLYLS